MKTNRQSPHSTNITSFVKRITYQRLRVNNEWGIRTEGYELLLTGELVQVTLANGTTKYETVGDAVWRGWVSGKFISLYKIYRPRPRKVNHV